MAALLPNAVSNRDMGGIVRRQVYSSFVADIVVAIGDASSQLCPREFRVSGGDIALQYRDGSTATIPAAHLTSPLIDCSVTHILSSASGTSASSVTVGW